MIKIIGIGNILMKDDGIAIVVLEQLRDNLEQKNIEVILGETDIQYSFHLLQKDDFVIILDAAYTGKVPGCIHLCELQEVITSYGDIGTPHDMSIFDLMRLYSSKVKGYFIGIEIAETGFGCELSTELKNNIYNICYQVEHIIQNLIKETNDL